MTARMRDHDWSATPFGPLEEWPQALKTALGICLNSSHPIAIYWGPELRLLYNDAWAPIPGERHPQALGRPAAEVWPDIWDVVGPQFARVIETGEGFATFDQMLPMLRDGDLAETYWNYSFTPILDEGGKISGIFNQGEETTAKVLAARTQAFLLDVEDRIRDAIAPDSDPVEALTRTLAAIGELTGAVRVGYAELEADGEHACVVEDWTRAPAAPLAGKRFRVVDYGEPLFAAVLNGQVVTVEDVRNDVRLKGATVDAFAGLASLGAMFVPMTRGGRIVAWVFVNDDKPRRWRAHEIDAVSAAAGRLSLGYEQALANARLRESEGRFAAIFGQADVGLAEFTLDGRFIRANEALLSLLGRSAAEVVGLNVAEVTHPEDVAETGRRIALAAEDGTPFQIEKRYVRPDGSHVWAVSNVTRLVDRRGRPSSFLAVVADISERRESERVRALLLAELNHRVKNNLSTVQALARQSRRSAAGPAEFEAAFDARLMALSRAHDLLMGQTWASASLAEIGAAVLAPFALEARERVTVEGPPVQLAPTAAVTMTMALHELATNAARFGALSDGDGRVAVAWTVDRERGLMEFAWRESGGPAVSQPEKRGYGSRLIERGLVQELGGEAQIDFAADGVICMFRVPLSQKVTAQ